MGVRTDYLEAAEAKPFIYFTQLVIINFNFWTFVAVTFVTGPVSLAK